MRVIAGQYRRRLLRAPAGLATRPTADRLRETLFNILAPRMAGAWFLDLYAGSGANGIEALSRGAERAVLVEKASAPLAALRANLAALAIPAARCQVAAEAVSAWLAKQEHDMPGRGFDVVFLDPPYDAAAEYESTLHLLGGPGSRILSGGAVVVAEHRRARPGPAPRAPADEYGRLIRDRVLVQGDAALSFYGLAGEAPV